MTTTYSYLQAVEALASVLGHIDLAELAEAFDLEAAIAEAFAETTEEQGTRYTLRVEPSELCRVLAHHPNYGTPVGTAHPCPPWCQEGPHPFLWRSSVSDRPYRVHRATYAAAPDPAPRVVVDAHEETPAPLDPTVHPVTQGPYIAISGAAGSGAEELTPSDARALAAALLEAAAALETNPTGGTR